MKFTSRTIKIEFEKYSKIPLKDLLKIILLVTFDLSAYD